MKAPELLTPREAADILKISYEQTLHLIKYGNLKSIKIGRQYRIKESDLTAFVNGGGTK